MNRMVCIAWFSLTLSACGSSSPGEIGQACSEGTCRDGLTCRDSRCAGSQGLDIEVESPLFDVEGTLHLVLSPHYEAWYGIDCEKELLSQTHAYADEPVTLRLDGIPVGDFMVVAYVPDSTDPGSAYMGFEWIKAEESYVTVYQERVTEIAIGLNGTAPLACAP